MNKGFYFANSQVIFVYDRNLNVRKRVFEYEDALKEYFKQPFRITAVPDSEDGNIQRFESKSHHGYSTIQASQFRVTLATQYSDEFRPNIKEIRKYLEERVNALIKLVSKEKLQYVAYIVELGFEMKPGSINKYLKKHTGTNAINDETREFALLYSNAFKSKYYVNIKCSKFQEHQLEYDRKSLTFKAKGDISHGISVTIDINTKLYFQKDKKFDFNFLKQTEEETFKIIQSITLEDYLKGKI